MADFQKAKQLAKKILEENLISSPPIPITDIAENHGLKVVQVDFGKHSPEVAGMIDKKTNAIYVNKYDNERRKAFTIAHELGHYLMHQDELEKNPEMAILFRMPFGKPDPNPLEQEANAFAARVLVPPFLLKQYLQKGINEPAILSEVFGVSAEVINYRIQDEKKGRN